MKDRINELLSTFDRTAEQYFSRREFTARLKAGKPLRVKFAVDASAPVLHLGHAVNLWMLRQMQNLGHRVVLVIGDVTTRIGDPDGRLDARPVVPQEEIESNIAQILEQARMVLRFDDPALIEVRRNSEWLDKLSLNEFLGYLSEVTHARLISRDMFQMRIKQGSEIYLHEMLYPVLQGLDTLHVEADVSIIGTDQLFNEMMGRTLQEKSRKKPQTIITTRMTAGIDGRTKQSQSLGNHIGLNMTPRDKFGRIMSIPDNLIDEYFRVYTDLPLEEIEKLQDEIRRKPRNAKIKLAYSIVGRYHGHEVAVWEREWFENTISRGEMPDDVPTLAIIDPNITLLELVQLARSDKSKSENRRLITQGGVQLNGEKLKDPKLGLALKTNDVLKLGKRSWFRIEVVRLSDFDSERLVFKSMQLQDLDILQKFLPEWEAAKLLDRPLPAKQALQVMQDVFRRVIMQADPKSEWLWKIHAKDNPDRVIGIGALRRDEKYGNMNIWMAPEYKNPVLAEEAMLAIQQQAFDELDFDRLLNRDIFSYSADLRQVEENLFRRFALLDLQISSKEIPDATWGFTREGWQKFQDLLERWRPEYRVNRPRTGFKKKMAEEKRQQQESQRKEIITRADKARMEAAFADMKTVEKKVEEERRLKQTFARKKADLEKNRPKPT